jgi:hypothetical protein
MLTVRGASQQSWMTDLRFGSLTDIEVQLLNVRFTPKSGHGAHQSSSVHVLLILHQITFDHLH